MLLLALLLAISGCVKKEEKVSKLTEEKEVEKITVSEEKTTEMEEAEEITLNETESAESDLELIKEALE